MKKDNIPGLEGYYISRLGTLWSRYHKSGKLTHSEWHKVKPNHNQKGYLFVQKKGKCWYLHRLVALAWIPNPNNYPIACHKDNVVTHNWYKNLYWGTQKDNMQQCIRDGRTLKGNKNPMYGISRRGAANPNAKLSKAQRREIRFRYESREKICRLANEFKVSRLTIRRIVNPSLRSFNRLV